MHENQAKPHTFPDLPGGTVTFLFTDIEGSTNLWDQNPKAMEVTLEQHNLLLQKAIAAHGGRVFKVIGDEFQAAFTQPLQAVEAALAAQRALLAEAWGETGPVRVRMGIHVGPGEVSGADYEASHTLNRVARINAAGHGGQILLSHVVADMVRGYLPQGVRLQDMGEHLLKGLSHPEHIFQVVAPDLRQDFPPLNSLETLPPKTALEVEPARLPAFLALELEVSPTPVFVGREQELVRLDGYLEQALSRHGGVVFIVGGPGRGKTALMNAFARRAMDAHPDLLVASGSCNAYTGMGDPYLPFQEIMDMLTGAVEAKYLSGTIAREHAIRLWEALPLVVDEIVNYGPYVVNTLVLAPALKHRAEVALPAHATLLRTLSESMKLHSVGSDGVEQSHLFQQVTNVLRALAAKHPLLLILDDLQWADSASISLLFHIGRRLQGSRILIIGAYRPVDVALGRNGDRHPLEMVLAEFKRLYGDVWVNLGQIDEIDSRRFVRLFLDTEPNRLDEDFRKTLVKHTGGHPLFTIELLRTMQERRDLIKDEEGQWVAGPELDWETLPARVEGVIEERIARLDDDLREILTVASVQGEEFTLQVLAGVKEEDERSLLRQLSRELDKKHHLIKEEITQQVEDKRLHIYRFRHNLFQQYLYSMLGEIERELLHGEIANQLEILYGRVAHQIAPQLAYHFNLAGNSEKARQYLIDSGHQARDRYANQEAIEYYSQALALIPENDLEIRYKLLLERERLFSMLGNREAQKADLAFLVSLAETFGEVEKQASVALRRAEFAESTGDYREAIAAAEQSTELAHEARLMELEASAQKVWGRALAMQGELADARMHLTQALELARSVETATQAETLTQDEVPWLKVEAGSLNNLAYISNVEGDHPGSMAYLEQALEIYRQIHDRGGESVMLQNLGIVSYDQGDFVSAQEYWEKSLRIFREIGDRQHEAMVMNSLGNISSDLRGDYAEAQRRYEQALAIAQEIGDKLNEGMILGNIGLVATYQQDFEKARDFTERSLEIYLEIGLKPELSGIFLILGRALAGLIQLDEAVDAYQLAIHHAEELAQYDPILEAQAGLARIAQVKGRLDHAQSQVEAILTQMDDDRILNQLEPEATLRVYLDCYLVLKANQNPRAGQVIDKAHASLQEQAAKIPDEITRQMFLENIPWHREIVEYYQKRHVQ